MKPYKKIVLSAIGVFMMMSCTDDSQPDFSVEKPDSVKAVEYLNKYDALKAYVDRTANPDFKLGAGATVSDYNSKGVFYRLANANFDELTAGYAMKHGAIVQDDGSLNLLNVEKFLELTEAAGLTVYGHTLCWHANQNATYLNNLMPTGVEFDPNDNRVNYINGSFENNEDGWNSWGGASSKEVVNGGIVGEKCLKFTHEANGNAWDAQIQAIFSSSPMPAGEYTLSFFVKSDLPGKFRCSTVSTGSNNEDVQYQQDIETGSSWKYVEWDIRSTGFLKALNYDMGYISGTYYLDEVRLNPKSDEFEKPIIIQLSKEEKAKIITEALDTWIAGMYSVTKDRVRTWDVVNEPMSDWPDPYELKTGENKELTPDEFYWQDYLGKDYAVTAFNLARKHGNETDILFINDYGLEYNLDKCKGLIEYVKYIERKGARVDGIGTQMHVSVSDANRETITEMFKLLAATGKKIKISELDLGLGDGKTTEEATEEDYIAQSELYEFIVSEYFKIIPPAQRYGITMWSPLDSPKTSSWRKGEPIGLWTESYTRKHAYAGFANGLAGRDISSDLD